MLVESLGYNLLSISRLAGFDFNVLFSKVGCQVFRRDIHNKAFTSFRRDDIYIVNSTKKHNLAHVLLQNLLKVGYDIEGQDMLVCVI